MIGPIKNGIKMVQDVDGTTMEEHIKRFHPNEVEN